MGIMEALLLVSPRTSILKEKCREWHRMRRGCWLTTVSGWWIYLVANGRVGRSRREHDVI